MPTFLTQWGAMTRVTITTIMCETKERNRPPHQGPMVIRVSSSVLKAVCNREAMGKRFVNIELARTVTLETAKAI